MNYLKTLIVSTWKCHRLAYNFTPRMGTNIAKPNSHKVMTLAENQEFIRIKYVIILMYLYSMLGWVELISACESPLLALSSINLSLLTLPEIIVFCS